MLTEETALKLAHAMEKLAIQFETFNQSLPYFQKQIGKVEAVQEARHIEQTTKADLNKEIESIFLNNNKT